MKPLNSLDRFLNGVTMYRLVFYSLLILAAIAIVFGFIGVLPYNGAGQLASLVMVMLGCFIVNDIACRIVKTPINIESFTISALILFFIITPIDRWQDAWIPFLGGGVAMASKYIFAIDRKHFLNPAAAGVFILGLFGITGSIWWIGSAVMLPFVAVAGLLVVRKVRRSHLFFSFIAVALLTTTLSNTLYGLSVWESLMQTVVSSPLIFFATFMLTEPLTTPPTRSLQNAYGMVVGIFYGLYFTAGPLVSSPELALLIGNIFAYTVSPKYKLFLKLKEKKEIADGVHEFSFSPDRSIKFLPGQYLEWTVAHGRVDSRGNRRYFTIASSPTESDIKLGIKMPAERPSYFKKTLTALKVGESIPAGQLAGDFVLPQDTDRKVVLIAGGIGVTPFRSQVQWLIDTEQSRDVTLFYTALREGEFAYKEVFEAGGKAFNLKTVYVLTDEKEIPSHWDGERGFITTDMLSKHVQDWQSHEYYLSGPNVMVESYKKMLTKAGVPRRSIHTDYFPGF